MIFQNRILLLICSLNHNVEIELRSGCKIGQNFYRKIYMFLSIFYFVQRGVTNAYVVCKNSISEFLNSKITFTSLSTPRILFSLSLTPPVDQIISWHLPLQFPYLPPSHHFLQLYDIKLYISCCDLPPSLYYTTSGQCVGCDVYMGGGDKEG